VLKAKDAWPRTSKVYCHPAVDWPRDPEIVQAVPVRSSVRRGAAIDLVLDRGREDRSLFVLTRIRAGREAIFWQTARTTKKAPPCPATNRTVMPRVARAERQTFAVPDQRAHHSGSLLLSTGRF